MQGAPRGGSLVVVLGCSSEVFDPTETQFMESLIQVFVWLVALFAGLCLLGLAERHLRRRSPRKASILVCVVLAPLLLLVLGQVRILYWHAGVLLRGEAETVTAELRTIYGSLFFLVLLAVGAMCYFGKNHPRPYAPSQFSPAPSLLWAVLYLFFGALHFQGLIRGRSWRSPEQPLEAVRLGQAEVSGALFSYGLAGVSGMLILLVCAAILYSRHRQLRAGGPYQSPLFGLLICSFGVAMLVGIVSDSYIGISFMYDSLAVILLHTLLSGAFVVHGLLLLHRVDWRRPVLEEDPGEEKPARSPGDELACS